MNCFELKKGSMRLLLADPLAADPYYRGTRFDRSGVILNLEYAEHSYVRPWYRRYDPFMHDAVSGPSEEFTQIGYDAAAPGDTFLKIGVGLLRRDDAPYNRFNLYEVVDSGRVSVEKKDDSALFRQELEGVYDYYKKVEILDDGRLIICHKLLNLGKELLDFYVYSHNFFILDGSSVGRATHFGFPFHPEGDWRAEYDCVRLTENGIAFNRDLLEGESVFMGNLHSPDGPVQDFIFTLANSDNGLRVEGKCDRKVAYSVFWSNHDVACIEPYVPLCVKPGSAVSWNLEYRFL